MFVVSRPMALRSGGVVASPRAAVQSDGPGVLITTSKELEEYLKSGSVTNSGVAVTPEKALSQAAVFGCVRLISGAAATMPLGLKRRVDARTREDASDHPVWGLLRRRPNRWMTPSAFRRLMTAHVLLRGNAYAMKVSSRGRVTELWPMHPDRVEPIQLDDMSIVYRYTRKDGQVVVLPQSEVMHLIGLTFDGLKGVSVIRYAAETIGLSIATETHGATVFRNGTQIGGVLKHPGNLGLEGQQVLRASLDAYRGAENAHKTMILEEGMDYVALGMTSEDAQYIETRKFTRGDIAMFFGVPPFMLGDTEKSTSWGTGIAEQGLGFIAYTLQDWLTCWEETIGRDLLGAPEDVDVYAKFNPAGLVRGDITKRYAAYAVARQWGWLSVNDIRELEDLNPVDGGDTYLQPLNMVPLTMDLAAAQAGAAPNDPNNPASAQVRAMVDRMMSAVANLTDAKMAELLGVAA